MPILEVTNTHLTQRCATCEGVRELGFRNLTPTSDEGDVLALPACSCGSVEFLVGAPPDEPPHPSPGSFGHRPPNLNNAGPRLPAARRARPRGLARFCRNHQDRWGTRSPRRQWACPSVSHEHTPSPTDIQRQLRQPLPPLVKAQPGPSKQLRSNPNGCYRQLSVIPSSCPAQPAEDRYHHRRSQRESVPMGCSRFVS